MDPQIPLVVSEVNADDLEGHPGIIANPNCSTMQLVPVLMAIRDSVGIERVIVDTYQAVSGTGADAIAEFEGQIRAHVAGEPKHASVYPHPIAFNALPAGRRLPRQRLHEGRVEGRHGEPQDPPPAGAPDQLDRGSRPGVRLALRGGPRRDARAIEPVPGSRAVRRRSRASSSRTIRRRRPIRWPPRPPAPTASTSAGSGSTNRSRTARGSRSGS